MTVFVKRSEGSLLSLVSLRAKRFLVAALRSKEVADQPSFLFVLDAGKKFCAQPDDCLRLIERQTVVHLTAGEMLEQLFGV